MSRMVQARVTDAQYDYLVERAMEGYDGDLSAALRAAISFAEIFEQVLQEPDPGAAIKAQLEKWEQEHFEERTTIKMDQADNDED